MDSLIASICAAGFRIGHSDLNDSGFMVEVLGANVSSLRRLFASHPHGRKRPRVYEPGRVYVMTLGADAWVEGHPSTLSLFPAPGA